MNRPVLPVGEQWRGRQVCVVGLGVTNRALIRYLAQKGAAVTGCDAKEDLGEAGRELTALGVSLVTGPNYLRGLDGHDLIFLTPGIPKHLPAIQAARDRGALLTGEIDLVLSLAKNPVIGITGSAGKTTTTMLIGEMLRAGGRPVVVGGNIGTPLIEQIESLPPETWVVLELSSFQLQLCRRSPHISLLTNITPNHLDVHANLTEYEQAKGNIFRFQMPRDFRVINADDPGSQAISHLGQGQVVRFSRQGDPGGEQATFLADGIIYARMGAAALPILRTDEVKLLGQHNLENVLAATAAAILAGVSQQAIRQAVTGFLGVEHRLEPVRVRAGVRWYNDSKATSPSEMLAALNTLTHPLVVIAGGYDKQLPFDPVAEPIVRQVHTLVLTGPTAPKIAAAVQAAAERLVVPGPRIHMATDMTDAVQTAARSAHAGDAVLLSPGCSSFDAYRNFEERGRHFKTLVQALPEV